MISLMRKNEPMVSVLMMAYNHEAYISQAIESVLQQHPETSLELLIGEDCSTDETREIVFRYQERYPEVIHVITSECNVGIYENYRRLLKAGRGEYFAHLDGDDYWFPGKLSAQIRFLRENEGCVAVYTNAITVDRLDKKVGLFNDVQTQEFDIGELVRRGNFLNMSSMMFRAGLRDVLLDIDRLFIDYQVHLRLARFGALVQLAEPLAAYRVCSSSSMLLASNDIVRRCYWQALMDVPRDLVSDKDFSSGLADFLRRTAFRALRTGRFGLLLKWTPRVMAESPVGGLAMARATLRLVAHQMFLAAKDVAVMGADRRRVKVLYRQGKSR